MYSIVEVPLPGHSKQGALTVASSFVIVPVLYLVVPDYDSLFFVEGRWVMLHWLFNLMFHGVRIINSREMYDLQSLMCLPFLGLHFGSFSCSLCHIFLACGKGENKYWKTCLTDYLKHYWFSVLYHSKWLTWLEPFYEIQNEVHLQNYKLGNWFTCHLACNMLSR